MRGPSCPAAPCRDGRRHPSSRGRKSNGRPSRTRRFSLKQKWNVEDGSGSSFDIMRRRSGPSRSLASHGMSIIRNRPRTRTSVRHARSGPDSGREGDGQTDADGAVSRLLTVKPRGYRQNGWSDRRRKLPGGGQRRIGSENEWGSLSFPLFALLNANLLQLSFSTH